MTNPPEERYIHEILCLTMYSRAMVSACVSGIAKRLNRTRNWVVALKALMLVHRLLTDGDHAYEREIFSAKRHGHASSTCLTSKIPLGNWMRGTTRHLCATMPYTWMRSLSLGWRAGARMETLHIMKKRTKKLLRPMMRWCGLRRYWCAAKHNRIVAVALYPIVKESFQLCCDITEVIGNLVERFMKLDIPSMQKLDMMDDFVSTKVGHVEKPEGHKRVGTKTKRMKETKAAEAEHVKHVIKEGNGSYRGFFSGPMATGSSSSVAQRSAGQTAMLALPAPPAANAGPSGPSSRTDPFAAFLALLPPGYVQMSEMEKKQRLLVEEQLFWQQYAKGGMSGQEVTYRGSEAFLFLCLEMASRNTRVDVIYGKF
ncbi:UNVERIFIED_CONTAM: putative clathrin assembly protein [Sesamum angustifolium]|uniref:Clathrin assembly protein n=1 Tax=Sesamum angustifolium TaxID=2727405 RepID=A0AAW2MTN6_9LAMI